MNKRTFLLIPFFAASLNAHSTDISYCLRKDGFISGMMRMAMIDDLGVNEKTLDDKKTTLTLISKTKVSPELASQLAKKDQTDLKAKGISLNMTWNDYYSTYMDDHVVNLIVKYTFVNKIGKKNIFIGSALINDNECSVGDGGYITVSREF